ncbi:MAG TPA: hypothetical protein VGJ62_13330 [Gemmatimonadaceae bacterium]|jgi:hypothetical protein
MAKRREDEVCTAFHRATEGTGSREELVAAVRARVRKLKNQGQPPEKVIVTIKRLCGLPLIALAADTDASTDGSESRQIAEIVVRAAIDEYYSERTAPVDRGVVLGGQL